MQIYDDEFETFVLLEDDFEIRHLSRLKVAEKPPGPSLVRVKQEEDDEEDEIIILSPPPSSEQVTQTDNKIRSDSEAGQTHKRPVSPDTSSEDEPSEKIFKSIQDNLFKSISPKHDPCRKSDVHAKKLPSILLKIVADQSKSRKKPHENWYFIRRKLSHHGLHYDLTEVTSLFGQILGRYLNALTTFNSYTQLSSKIQNLTCLHLKINYKSIVDPGTERRLEEARRQFVESTCIYVSRHTLKFTGFAGTAPAMAEEILMECLLHVQYTCVTRDVDENWKSVESLLYNPHQDLRNQVFAGMVKKYTDVLDTCDGERDACEKLSYFYHFRHVLRIDYFLKNCDSVYEKEKLNQERSTSKESKK